MVRILIISILRMHHHTLVFHIIKLGKKVQKALGHKPYPFSLGVSQASAVVFISQHKSINQSEIAKHLHMEPASMVTLIDELERIGLVNRDSHKIDRRHNKITLTAKGKKTVAKIGKVTEKLDNYLRNKKTKNDVKTLLNLTEKLSNNLDKWKGGENALPKPKRTLENGHAQTS
ncbi:MarR family transcriptional regulator [Candidatus Curtissbacteria bacterium]|nr:MarR family transcriptional regulator [Candidatus Curtissbacteria bacterium]